MKNKILLMLLMGMFLLTVVAAEPKYIGKQYNDLTIIETCVVGGFPCDTSYLCNITVEDPNLDVIILNFPMTRNDTMYNYTFKSTDLLGDYTYNTYCLNGTFSGNQEEVLRVTTTGREPKVKITLILLFSALILFLVAILIKNHSVGFISGLLFSMGGVYLMIYGLEDVADMYTRAIALIVIAFGALITLTAGYEWLDELD